MKNQCKFSTNIDVRIGDINYGGHLGNDKYLLIFQDARLRYLKQFGYSEVSIGDDTGLIMSQAHINYKAEAFWEDELTVFTRISKIERIKFMFEYLIVNMQKQETVIATGFTEMVSFDYNKRKIRKLPDEFIKRINLYEQFSQ